MNGRTVHLVKELNFAKKNLERFDYKKNLNKYLETVKECM